MAEKVQCTLTNPSSWEKWVTNARNLHEKKMYRALMSNSTPLMMTRDEAKRLAKFLAKRLVK